MSFGASNNVSQVTVGSLAPDFRLRTDRDEVWRLSDHRDGVTVLLFYPQNETLVCTKQMCSVRDNWESYLATKATIVGTPSGFELLHFASKNTNIPFFSK